MERSTYTVTHHGLLIGLYGKTLEEHLAGSWKITGIKVR